MVHGSFGAIFSNKKSFEWKKNHWKIESSFHSFDEIVRFTDKKLKKTHTQKATEIPFFPQKTPTKSIPSAS